MQRGCSHGMLAFAQPALARAQAAPSVALDSATTAAIAPIVAEARAKQLPVDLLYVKAREGQVMRAPLTPSRPPCARWRTDCTWPTMHSRRIRAIRSCVQPWMPSRRACRARRCGPCGRPARDESLAVPLGVLTQLVVSGVPVEKASMRIVDLLQRGAAPKNFIALNESVRQDVRRAGVLTNRWICD